MTIPDSTKFAAKRELAILGGKPLFHEPLHVGKPNLGDRRQFLERVEKMLDRRWFSNNGPLVREFEERITKFLGVNHCVAMCNATVALEAAGRALNLEGEVIVPAYTFVASAHAFRWQGITPVFADIDPLTQTINPAKIEALITPRTRAIVGVHLWGRPCDAESIDAIARKHGLSVIYDAAHAFGCSHKGRMIGGNGNCEVFSFHATKFLNSFEGGAIVTNDEALAERLRLIRNFGFAGYDQVTELGTNGKMTEVCAAMGLTSLDIIDELVACNRANWHRYREQLAGLPGIKLLDYDEQECCNYQYVVVEVDAEHSSLSRDELIPVLHNENILARKYFWPGVHRMAPYVFSAPAGSSSVPETERVAARVMVLPTGQSVSDANIRDVCGVVRQAIERAAEVKDAISRTKRKEERLLPLREKYAGIQPYRSPLTVSVLMLTYNHEAYIAQAIESVLEQRTSFPVELIIGDDCSTDKTAEIVGRYAQRYPGLIQAVSRPRNIGPAENARDIFSKATGEFVACLEGDDFWTHAEKLERQVAFMRENTGCTISHHRVSHLDQSSGKIIGQFPQAKFRAPRVEARALVECNFLRGCTVMYRRNAILSTNPSLWKLGMLDWPLFALLADAGWIGYLDEDMATYRLHATSFWTPQSRAQKLEAEHGVARYLIRNLRRESRDEWIDRFLYEIYADQPSRNIAQRGLRLLRNTVWRDPRLFPALVARVIGRR